MKLFFDSQIFSWQVHGGISRYFIELARRLAELDHINFRIIAPLYVNRFLRAEHNIPVSGIYTPKLPFTTTLYKKANWLLTRSTMQRHRPDIIHETFYTAKPVAPSAARTVITVHDLIHEKFPDLYAGQRHITAAKAAAILRADHIICVSHNTRRDLCELYKVPLAKTSVVHHGVAQPMGPFPAIPKGINKPYLLFVGSRGPHKNFPRLLQALAIVSKSLSRLTLVCFGGAPFTGEERQRITSLGLSANQVVWLSGSDQLLHALYREALGFIYPSLYEGFGLPILEAMSAGCPVLCGRTSSLPEVAGDAALYFNPGEADEIGQAIAQISSDQTTREKLIRAGRDRHTLFSWDACFTKTMEVYRNLG